MTDMSVFLYQDQIIFGLMWELSVMVETPNPQVIEHLNRFWSILFLLTANITVNNVSNSHFHDNEWY